MGCSFLPKKLTLAGLVLAVAFPAGMWLLQPRPALVVEETRGARTVWAVPAREGETFYLRYIHSVNRRRVEDTYRVLGGEIVLTETRFEAQGAGLGYMGEGVESARNGWTIISGLHRRLPVLYLRVGSIADHCLVIRDTEFHLWDRVPPFSLVAIRVRPLDRLHCWVISWRGQPGGYGGAQASGFLLR
jgi:hypothetical protein